MAELNLSRDQRLALKARAHHLNPVVLLGAAGLSAAVVTEVDRALKAHELIKIRAPGDDRIEREATFITLAERLGAARVQMIGKLLVLYRPRPPDPQQAENPAPATERGRRIAAAARPTRREKVRPIEDETRRQGAGRGHDRRSGPRPKP